MILRLDDTERAQFETTGVVVVRGEVGPAHPNRVFLPSTWANTAKLCTSCDGHGWQTNHGPGIIGSGVNDRQRSGYEKQTPDCPDCHEGRTVFDLRVTCAHCVVLFNATCDHCDDGSVSLGRYAVELLPVVRWNDHTSHTEDHTCVGEGVVLRSFATHDEFLELDPAPRPGIDQVAVFTRIGDAG